MSQFYRTLTAATTLVAAIFISSAHSYAATPATYKLTVYARPATFTLANLTVECTPYGSSTPLTAQTNQDGEAVFNNLAPNSYKINVPGTSNYKPAESAVMIDHSNVTKTIILTSVATYNIQFNVTGTNKPVDITATEKTQGLIKTATLTPPSNTIALEEGNWLIQATTPDKLPITLTLRVGPSFDDQKHLIPPSTIKLDLSFKQSDATPISKERTFNCSSLGQSGDKTVFPTSFLLLALGLAFQRRRRALHT